MKVAATKGTTSRGDLPMAVFETETMPARKSSRCTSILFVEGFQANGTFQKGCGLFFACRHGRVGILIVDLCSLCSFFERKRQLSPLDLAGSLFLSRRDGFRSALMRLDTKRFEY